MIINQCDASSLLVISPSNFPLALPLDVIKTTSNSLLELLDVLKASLIFFRFAFFETNKTVLLPTNLVSLDKSPTHKEVKSTFSLPFIIYLKRAERFNIPIIFSFSIIGILE